MLVSQREGGGNIWTDLIGPMNTVMQKPYHIYKNAPICPECGVPMAYLYTHIASNRSVWKCRECNVREEVTPGYPDDDGDPSKRPMIFISTPAYGYIIVPGDNYGNRRIREDYLRFKDKQTEISGRGRREQISTIYALHI